MVVLQEYWTSPPRSAASSLRTLGALVCAQEPLTSTARCCTAKCWLRRQNLPPCAVLWSQPWSALSGGLLVQCARFVTIAGTVNADSREISLTTNILGWRDTKPPTWLARFGVPVLVENEANMAAFSEYRYGAAAGTSVALFLALGAGVGAGVLINGQLFRGATGAAGEIGRSRTTSRAGDEVLEQQTAAPGLLARYRQMKGVDLRNPVELFSLAQQGDRTAGVVVAQALDQLAIAVTNAILLVDPQRIIVGGGISTAGDLLLKPLQERVSTLLDAAPPEFVVGKLGPDAALLGAAAFAAQAAAERLVSEVSYLA